MGLDAAVIFDLDGTLTRPVLDFNAIREEIGIASGPILEGIAMMSASDRLRADEILNRHECHAAEHSLLYEGAVSLLNRLRDAGYPVAVLTRNARPWVDIVFKKHGIVVDALRTRDDGTIKPSAEPVLHLCRILNAKPEQSWMIGDYLFDIQSGRDAGTRTILMIGEADMPHYASQADHVIRALPEVWSIVTG